MSRNISAHFRSVINSQDSDEVPIMLITLDHPDLAVPIRVSSDGVDTVSRGNTFIGYRFDLRLPDDNEETVSLAQIRIANVDRAIGEAIRIIQSPPNVLIELVTATQPDILEASYPSFLLKNASYDALTVSGSIALRDFSDEPYPAESYTPASHPGLF